MAFRSGKVGGAGPGVRTRLSLTLWQCLATCDSQGPGSLESRLTGGQQGPPPGPGRTRGLLLPKNQPLQRWRCICIMRVLYTVGVLESPMQRGPGWKGPREPWRLRPTGAERPTPLSRPDLEPPVASRVRTWRDEVDTAWPGAGTFEFRFQLSGHSASARPGALAVKGRVSVQGADASSPF